ncbi:signal peptidase I [Gleimia sp. 6138-11-ORH1]|uniref:signal peptidase I n=1 Tax=Gleimia sp. 6138-11-ORH1 TaxID=2973937 RepID=UPI0021685CFC|nr:signal peptidase I [Gleimia sp. 6138-11-ORH1]MCS4484890.1 signal peptidase I [Gleimia sp. 6138-11-ORH1]
MSETQSKKNLPYEGTRAQRRAHRPLHAMPNTHPAESAKTESSFGSKLEKVESTATSSSTRPFPSRVELRAQQNQGKTTDPTESETTAEPQSKLRKVGSFIREYTIVIVLAVTISALIRAFLFQAFWIPSGSMSPTLEVGDSVAVSRLTPRFFEIKRGDVIVFNDTQQWLPPAAENDSKLNWIIKPLEFLGLRPASSEQFLVKRVIGVPGDKVVCCNSLDQLVINDKPITEPYLASGSDNSLIPFEVTIPEGKLWVMGDNRNNSADSRAHRNVNNGMVNIEDVVGKVVVVIWPHTSWKNPTNHEPFNEVPNQPVKSN